MLLCKIISQYRDSPQARRERRYRQRPLDEARDTDRRTQRMHMDRDENREQRKERLRQRLGPRDRKGDERGESSDNKQDPASRWKQRNERFCKYPCHLLSFLLVDRKKTKIVVKDFHITTPFNNIQALSFNHSYRFA